MNGYGGTVARVNLTTGRIAKQPLDPWLVAEYLGGRGFGAYLLFAETREGIDPLGPENPLIVSTGPLTGLLVPGGGRADFTCKSPLTGGYAGANMGGMLSAEMKYAGYDSLVIEGAADKPVYLLIDDDRIEIRPADGLWGRGSVAAEQALKETLGEGFQIATIGPAGENQAKHACISHDYGRQAGRGGVGAVMGSKRLKAIAIRGTRSVAVADMAGYKSMGRAMYAACKASPGIGVWQKYGTPLFVRWSNERGAFPTRNFQSGFIEGYESLSAEVMRERIVVSDKACFGCPSPCGKYSYSAKHDTYVEGPEYETAALLGGNTALLDIDDLAYANYLCDDLGLDTISTGNAIAFAMECYERGVLTPAEADGLDLAWGNPQAIFALIEKMARREGIGGVLAEGVKHAAEVWGQGSGDYAIHVKGMEVSGYEPHNAPAMLLSYMTCDVGAHHSRSWAMGYDLEVGRDDVTPEKAARVIELQHIRPLFDVLGCCRLQWMELPLDLDHYPRILAAITGVNRSWEELLKISERVWNLTRMYWVREIDGFGRLWDLPAPRFWKDPIVSGRTQGKLIARADVDKLLDMYYGQRDWDSNGIPTRRKLEELGLTCAGAV